MLKKLVLGLAVTLGVAYGSTSSASGWCSFEYQSASVACDQIYGAGTTGAYSCKVTAYNNYKACIAAQSPTPRPY